MRAEAPGESRIEVDPVTLDKVADVLHDVGVVVKKAGVQAQADTITAAKAFDRWATGASLNILATRWDKELHRMADDAAGLCNALAAAASGYRAADGHGLTKTVDQTYFRGQ